MTENKPENPDREFLRRLSAHTGFPVSKIAQEAKIAASTLTRVMSSRTSYRLSAPTVDRLRERFPDFFDTSHEVISDPTSAYTSVDVLPSYAGMGGGGSGEGDREVALIPRRLVEEKLRANPKDLLMIEVRGESMQPDFLHGDQILIDRRDTVPVQPGAFCLWDGDGYVVKLVERLPGKRGWLRIFSTNERYSAYEVDSADVKIMGRPVWIGREL